MNKAILILTFIFSFVFTQDVQLGIDNVNADVGYLEIRYSSDQQISGFQFNITGLNIESVVSNLDFVEFSSNSGFVLGYLGQSGYLPTSENSLLCSIVFTPQAESTICLDNIIIAGQGGSNLSIDDVDCLGVPAAYTDCSGVYGGSDLPPEKFDCSGDCCTEDNLSDECNLWESDYVVDCNGVCDGSAFFDSCGVCSGGDTEHDEDSDLDCNGVCFGDAYIDECGYCNSGAPSCPTIVDVPDDQGFQVYINFQPSQFDDDSLRTSEGYSIERLDDGVWTSLNSFYAYGNDNYQTVAVTLINSIEDDNGVITQENNSTFRIIAAMDEGNFATLPFEGTSIDNIHPGTPEILESSSQILDSDLQLTWNESPDLDIDYYSIYLEDSDQPFAYSSENSVFTSSVDECYLADYQFSLESVDIHDNTSDRGDVVLNHKASDYTLDLHYGSNLVSFYALPDDTSLDAILGQLDGIVTAVTAEGVAASPNPALGWVGSLSEFEPGKGYWIKVNEACQLTISNATYVGGDFEYELHYGANLISFPAPNSIDVGPALPENFEQNVNGIIGEGTAASPNPVLGWVGSLTQFEGKKGYWVKLDTADSFKYEVCTEID